MNERMRVSLGDKAKGPRASGAKGGLPAEQLIGRLERDEREARASLASGTIKKRRPPGTTTI